MSAPEILATTVTDEKLGDARSGPTLITEETGFAKSLATTDSASASIHEKLSTTTDSSSASIVEKLNDFQFPLSTARLCVAHFGAASTLFLATTDATIVSTSLPTIASDLVASESEYTWVAVAYLLTQTAFQPLYGRLSELLGRKTLLYSSIAIFAVGSLLCGSARTITWLIAARAIAGIGGGGIVSSVWTITAEIVEVKNRAKWSQALSVTWSCSAIAGPLLGGVFSSGDSSPSLSSISWRWGFYVNIPICAFASLVLCLALRGVTLGTSSNASWSTFATKFDFIGLVLFMNGTGAIVVGFSFASEKGWSAASTLCLIIIGLSVLLFGCIYEARTTREAIFPPSIFKNRTAVIILCVNFLHNFAFNAGTFYLSLYYQVANDATPFASGMMLLPYSLGSSLASMPAAWFIGFWQKRAQNTSGQNWVITVGALISTIGFGLLNLLDERTPMSLQITFALISGIGVGMLFHPPYQVFTRALTPSEIGPATSAFFLVRFTGATIGLAVAGAIFYGRLSGLLPSNLKLQDNKLDLAVLQTIEPLSLKIDVLHAVASSIQTIWTVCTPCLGVTFALSTLLRRFPIDDTREADLARDQKSDVQVLGKAEHV